MSGKVLSLLFQLMISQKEQLDVVVQYWDGDVGQMNTKYFNSLFLEKSTASNILEKLLEMIK